MPGPSEGHISVRARLRRRDAPHAAPGGQSNQHDECRHHPSRHVRRTVTPSVVQVLLSELLDTNPTGSVAFTLAMARLNAYADGVQPMRGLLLFSASPNAHVIRSADAEALRRLGGCDGGLADSVPKSRLRLWAVPATGRPYQGMRSRNAELCEASVRPKVRRSWQRASKCVRTPLSSVADDTASGRMNHARR